MMEEIIAAVEITGWGAFLAVCIWTFMCPSAKPDASEFYGDQWGPDEDR